MVKNLKVKKNILWQKYFMSLLQEHLSKLKKKNQKKNLKKYKNKNLLIKKNLKKYKNKNLLIKKNILLNKVFKKKINFKKKYKKYKLLNFKILQKKKFLYLNFYNRFFDILIWALFVFYNINSKYSFKSKKLKNNKKK